MLCPIELNISSYAGFELTILSVAILGHTFMHTTLFVLHGFKNHFILFLMCAWLFVLPFPGFVYNWTHILCVCCFIM